MISQMTFLIGCGSLSECSMNSAAIALSCFWGGELRKYSCYEKPNEVIASLSTQKGLIQLNGDAAMTTSPEGCWLDALGAWKKPVVLMVEPLSTGHVPGAAKAYFALCKELCVPVIGLLQLGGDWDLIQRKLDGLPWCGHLASNVLNNNSENKSSPLFLELQNTVYKLKVRSANLS